MIKYFALCARAVEKNKFLTKSVWTHSIQPSENCLSSLAQPKWFLIHLLSTKTSLMQKLFTTLMSALALTACSSVSVTGTASVGISRYPGLLSVTINPESHVVYTKVSSIGAANSHSHFSIGWLREETVAFANPADCRVVIITDGVELVLQLESYLNQSGLDLSTVCLVQKEEIK